MKQLIQKRFLFIFKSMLWSLLLYVSLMLAFNWDDVSKAASGQNMITIVTNGQETPADPCVTCAKRDSRHTNLIKGILAVVKTVAGVAKVAAE